MERKKNDSLKENKKVNKENTYIGSIVTLVLSLVFAFVVLVSIQAIMGEKTVSITVNKAEQYYYDGKLDDAINEYMTMQNDDIWPIWTVKAAEVYSVQGDVTQSDNLLREAMVKRDKAMLEGGDKYIEQDKELINQVVFTFYINNELDQAESLGEYYLTKYSTYKPLLKTMFAIYLAKEDTKSAEEIVKSYPVNEEDAYDLAVLAKMEMMLGNYDDGLSNLKKSYNLDKNEIKSFDVIMETSEFDKDKLLNKLKELSEEAPKEEAYKVWIDEINMLDSSNMDLDEAITNEINDNINIEALDKDSYVYNYAEAWNYYNKGQYDKALEYCNAAIVANPEYENTFGILMPKILIANGNADKIEGYFRTAIYNEPFNYNLITSMGKVYESDVQNYDKAKASLNFALSLNKDEDALYYDLAFVDMDMENTDEAIKDLNEAISINKDYYKYYRTLGTVYFNDKNYEKAIENIRKAYSLNEKDVLSLNNAACYYIMVDKDIWRGYSNIESAYNDMPSDLDQVSKDLITKNYEKIKKVYDKYVNDENTAVEINDLELSY
ncbi:MULTISPECIES: tetratricopeptide repeat protein [unclassified Clostridium]|uniref:tetratricopeptide repeat protein n=1 Tax=Clostridium TaxID=1485 RepID=UPI001C8C9548|nr:MULTISPECIES: tetratricopeptide repeat protein [unclassified Clostridium]MBX9136748.1 tetratricopeptide repeat protein [Clostridium sp. K12(2020)]MBX9145173.1 tetratricopeptide repeat protein [Clostridium sp. K13]MDU2290561.1 tetratricopeptide repeat protein [Clostridium celatum]MDU4326270.1 tetratricopeptide repeat protein [Clostridium celatum]